MSKVKRIIHGQEVWVTLCPPGAAMGSRDLDEQRYSGLGRQKHAQALGAGNSRKLVRPVNGQS